MTYDQYIITQLRVTAWMQLLAWIPGEAPITGTKLQGGLLAIQSDWKSLPYPLNPMQVASLADQSEARERVNMLLAVKPGDLTDMQRWELSALAERLQQIEPDEPAQEDRE